MLVHLDGITVALLVHVCTCMHMLVQNVEDGRHNMQCARAWTQAHSWFRAKFSTYRAHQQPESPPSYCDHYKRVPAKRYLMYPSDASKNGVTDDSGTPASTLFRY